MRYYLSPLWFRRLVCRLGGHEHAKLVKYGRRHVLVGWGCTRCEHGQTRRYRTLGPIPAAVKERQVST